MRIVQVLPRAPDAEEALGAFALALASDLDGLGIRSDLVAVQAGASVRLEPAFRGPDAPALSVLLHYVNYAYDSRGIPGGLVDGIEAWRRGGSGRLVTVFHEVHASGPPWRSSFWLAPIQRRLAARLLMASDAAVTSLPRYRGLLRRLGGDALVLPVFSTCGEPQVIPPFESRAPRLVVFGSPGNRSRIYGRLRAGLAWAARVLEVRVIHDVGVPIPLPESIEGVPVKGLGRLSSSEVSAQMLAARGGVVAHPLEYLPKSTTYAGYAAHGAVPVALGIASHQPEGMAPALAPDMGAVPLAEARAVADLARAAYTSHSRAVHASTYERLFDPSLARA